MEPLTGPFSGRSHPPPINRQLLGLLGLLDIQNSGRSPGYVDAAVAPMISIDRFLTAQPQRFTGTGSFATVGGAISTLSVPNGEAWIVTSFAVSSNALGAGQAFVGCPAVFGPAPGNQFKYQGEPLPIALTTGDAVQLRFGPPSGWFVVGPGEQFGGVSIRLSAGPLAFTCVVWAIPVRI